MVITIDKEKFYEVLKKFPVIEEEFLSEYEKECLVQNDAKTKKAIVLKQIRELWNARILIRIGESKTVSIFYRNQRLNNNKFIVSLAAESKYFGKEK